MVGFRTLLSRAVEEDEGMIPLLVATRNIHKTEEIASILGEGYQVSDLTTLPGAPDVEETGSTFLENAGLKALAISSVTGSLVLADDSGLEVDALEGRPGVYSARYAGLEAKDSDNNTKLLSELEGVGENRRTARFRCVMVLAEAGEILNDFSGSVEGRILEKPRGHSGFGYDPLFVPRGERKSFAELGPDIKNGLSHRARAMEEVSAWLRLRNGGIPGASLDKV